MKKLMCIGFLTIAFLFISPQVSAQTGQQKELWNLAKQETEQFAQKVDLNDNQKAYTQRAIYNYHAETMAQTRPTKYTKKMSKEKIDENLFNRLKEGLSEEQINKFKSMKDEVLKTKPKVLKKKMRKIK